MSSEYQFKLYMDDLSKCKDSMLFDSGTCVATYGKSDDYVSLEVDGEVDVEYNGKHYRHASEMPQELIKKFESNDWLFDEDMTVYANNWFSCVHFYEGSACPDDVLVEAEDICTSDAELESFLADMLEIFDSQMQ